MLGAHPHVMCALLSNTELQPKPGPCHLHRFCTSAECDPISEVCHRGWHCQFSIIFCTPAAAHLLHAAGATAAAFGLAIEPSQHALHATDKTISPAQHRALAGH